MGTLQKIIASHCFKFPPPTCYSSACWKSDNQLSILIHPRICRISSSAWVSSNSNDVALFRRIYSRDTSCGLNKRLFSRYVDGLVSSTVKTAPPWNVLFFGTDEYALAHLKHLFDNSQTGDYKLVQRLEVVVPKSKSVVRNFAEENRLQYYEWPITVPVGRHDVGVVVSFGHLIPKRIIDSFPYGILNVHPSILPRWRGASPIIHTILNGDKETGISIMEIRPKHFDVGPLLLQTKYAVPDNCTALQLRDYLAKEGSTLMLQALHQLTTLENMEYEQREYGITYAHKLNAINARVNWEMQSPNDIDRQYRALSDIFGLRSQWSGQPVRLLDMVPLQEMEAEDIQKKLDEVFPDDVMTVRPGIPYYHDGRGILCIRCREGWVGFGGITIKKPMSAKCFHNGYLSQTAFQATAFDSQSNELDKYTFRTRTSVSKLQLLGRSYGRVV